MSWLTVLVASAISYLTKLAGLLVPRKVIEHPKVRRIAPLFPVTLLSALILVQTFTSGERYVLDARAAGLAVAVVAAALRAPFIVVVVSACVTAALVRLAVG